MTHAPIWLFDLDNTLHNASAHIFPRINQRMTAYLQTHLGISEDEANALRVHYWHRYGATLLGLMRHHGTCPTHFLDETHRDVVARHFVVFERALATRLRRLPGRKIVFTNGPRRYAEAVLAQIGLTRTFDDVFGIEAMNYRPKPFRDAFHAVLRKHRLAAHRCILVEDSLENLAVARRLGMRTVWIDRSSRHSALVDLKLRNITRIDRAMTLFDRPALPR